jgi:hypothetical protein
MLRRGGAGPAASCCGQREVFVLVARVRREPEPVVAEMPQVPGRAAGRTRRAKGRQDCQKAFYLKTLPAHAGFGSYPPWIGTRRPVFALTSAHTGFAARPHAACGAASTRRA